MSLQLLGDKKHLEGEDCNIPKIIHELVGIFNFVLLLCLKNKRAKEVNNSP